MRCTAGSRPDPAAVAGPIGDLQHARRLAQVVPARTGETADLRSRQDAVSRMQTWVTRWASMTGPDWRGSPWLRSQASHPLWRARPCSRAPVLGCYAAGPRRIRLALRTKIFGWRSVPAAAPASGYALW